MPFGTSLVVLFQDVWTRTNEPIFKHVSVPGTYQKPAPYRLQTFTYSTGLAFTGRSAACAPPAATRTAALPNKNLRIAPLPRLVFPECTQFPMSGGTRLGTAGHTLRRKAQFRYDSGPFRTIPVACGAAATLVTALQHAPDGAAPGVIPHQSCAIIGASGTIPGNARLPDDMRGRE
jgi:hypothetical protein